jgi:hypothetical protein
MQTDFQSKPDGETNRSPRKDFLVPVELVEALTID